MQPPGDITQLLAAAREGDPAAESRLIGLVYPELRTLASRYMRRERDSHTLQPTALVHEAYLRLIRGEVAELKDRTHFFAVAARIMRQILIDWARRKAASKHGGGLQRLDIEVMPVSVAPLHEQVLVLDQALTRLSEAAPRQSRVVEMMYFGGLTEHEVAVVLQVNERTVRRDWQVARAWLQAELNGSPR